MSAHTAIAAETFSMREWQRATQLTQETDWDAIQGTAYPMPPSSLARDEVSLHRSITLEYETAGVWIAWTRVGPFLLTRVGMDGSGPWWEMELEGDIIDSHPNGPNHKRVVQQWMEEHDLLAAKTKTRGELVTILRAALAR